LEPAVVGTRTSGPPGAVEPPDRPRRAARVGSVWAAVWPTRAAAARAVGAIQRTAGSAARAVGTIQRAVGAVLGGAIRRPCRPARRARGTIGPEARPARPARPAARASRDADAAAWDPSAGLAPVTPAAVPASGAAAAGGASIGAVRSSGRRSPVATVSAGRA